MPVQLRVLTLNCWAIPLFSSDIPERFQAIGAELCTGKYDLVSLQEVWSEEVYKQLVSQVQDVLPYHHHFYSGWHGSGVCIFSKHPIIDTCQYRFTLNGYPHKPQHPDWYGGKLVGLCRIQYAGTEINLYASHTHTEYHRIHDEYRAHRISQAFELSEFIRHTSQSADVNILAGDLNNQPFEIGLKIIQSNTGMDDAWLTTEHKSAEDSGLTWNRPDNNYSCDANYPPLRIDYVFYKGSDRCKVRCLHCETTLHKVPGKPHNYSDHEGVLAHLELEKVSGPTEVTLSPTDVSQRNAHLRQAVQILEEKIASTSSDRLFYAAVLLLALLLLILSTDWLLRLHVMTSLLHLLLGLAIGWSFWMGVVATEIERRGLLATKCSMEVLLHASVKKTT